MYLVLMAAIGPALVAWRVADTIDWGPWFVLLAAGTVVAAFVWRTPPMTRARAAGFWFVAIAPPLWVLAAGLLANAFLGGGPLERHPSEVLREARARKGADALVFRDYRQRSDELEVSRLNPHLVGLAVGDRVVLVVRPGLFGWPRLAGIEKGAPAE
ncbi:hypothetical protein SAMN02745121_05832 [Nannocystis exedens]|uniref:Uncharacterized protein n=2 Tax=Nannocystis exedens TaxID=54 RepID=A0A1I2E077_9BACT|nr:hypothetical protein NAEX_02209 [Nannocystis exedens]SFE86077.1 hypothetical protein SAMN02745121_05832 [Nannocystis exedens]